MKRPATLPDRAAARRERHVGIACGLALVVLYAAFNLVSRLGLTSALKTLDIAALRFGTAGLIMLPVLWHYGLAGVRALDAAGLVVCGGLGFALCAYAGLSLAPAAHASVLIHGALPLFSFLLMRLTAPAPVGRWRRLGLAGIALGIGAMAVDSLAGSSGLQWVGDGFLVLASIAWSAYGLQVRRLNLAPAHSGAIIAVFSACCYMPLYALLPGKALLAVGWQDLLVQAVVQGALIGALGIFIYARAVASLGAVGTAIFVAAVPCVSTVGGAWLLGEHPSLLAVAGVLVVTAGMLVSMKS